ncbi:hypothetical protein [Streptomyces natalensis]|uniref:Uncharacterized protein n=1 Tax=Streptomyces natalensis ATCC 27448 TaxID=1240678 RepID=A0A0D7CID9_9ACTN|nr:hypothetical protein [Streptomyces natalensis]KIZ15630.1 hypothetical protein SNA_25755 [Streptomyces natalensis ATCC 27448]
MSLTRERIVAWLATLAAVLVATLALLTGVGLGNLIGVTILTYITAVALAAWKVPLLQPRKVISATGRGAVVTAVVIVLLLISIGRSVAGVMS